MSLFLIILDLSAYLYKIWTQIQGDHSCKLLPIRHFKSRIKMVLKSLQKTNRHQLTHKIKDSNQLHLDNIGHHLLHLSKLKLWYNCLAIYQRDIVNILFIFLAKYAFIMEQSRMPCPVCHFQGVDYVSLTPGCAAYSWSICLFIFTGLLCFWIPFVCDGCKDIKISCSKCRRTKCIIEKPCC